MQQDKNSRLHLDLEKRTDKTKKKKKYKKKKKVSTIRNDHITKTTTERDIHGWQSHCEGEEDSSFKYISFSLLQLSMFFQFRSTQFAEPSFSCANPVGQSKHLGLNGVFWSLNFPASQGLHEVPATSEYVPLEHSVQMVNPCPLEYPCGH